MYKCFIGTSWIARTIPPLDRPGLKTHLEENCRLAFRDEDTCLIFALEKEVRPSELLASSNGNGAAH